MYGASRVEPMKRSLLLLSLFLLATAGSLAQTQRVLHLATGTPADSALENVLTRAIRVELMRAGLSELAYDTAERGRPTSESVEEAAASASVDYVLLLVYEESNETGSSGTNQLKIVLTVTETASGAVLHESEFTSPVDLDLDSRVASALRAMVAQTRIGGERVSGAGDSDTTGPVVAGPTNGGDAQVGSSPATVQVGQPEPSRVVEPPTGIGTTVAGAAMIVIGRASDFFRYGYTASLVVDYRFSLASFGVTAGVQAAFSQLFPAAGIRPGQVLLVSLGPNVSAGTVERRPVRLSGHISGGPAILMIEPDGSAFQAKLVPYVSAGIEATLGIGSSFFLGIEVNFMIAFEDVYPVMGLVPSIVIGLGP